MKTTKGKTGKTVVNHKQAAALVDRFVKEPNWAKDIRIMKKLMRENGSDVWEYIFPPYMNSVLWFYTKDGEKEIKKGFGVMNSIEKEKKSSFSEDNKEYSKVSVAKKSLKKRLLE